MKALRSKRWFLVLSVALALTVMVSMMPVAHAASNYTIKTCPTSADIVKACKAAGYPVSSVQAASILRSCKSAGLSVSALNVTAAVKACKTSGSPSAPQMLPLY